MKRILTFILIFALLPITMLFPMPVSAAVEITDELYEMPQMMEYDEEWVVYDPNDKSKVVKCNRASELVDVNDGVVLALNAPGKSELIEFKAPYLSTKPISIDTYDYNELALRVQLYVSDPTVLTSNCEMELTSSGTCDKLELNFGPHKQHKLTQGWNYMYLPFSEGAIKNGQLDVTKINYMRFYFFLKEEITMALGKVSIVAMNPLNVSENFDSAAALSAWTAQGGTLSQENGAAKATVNGTLTLTPSFELPIYKPNRTLIRLRLKASIPDALTSVSVSLKDRAAATATGEFSLVGKDCSSYQEIQFLCGDLKADKDFNFELTKQLSLSIQSGASCDVSIDSFSVTTYDSDYFYDWYYGYKAEPGEYSIAVIPDIQELSAAYPHKLNTIMQWIADNKEKENILFALDLGDVTWNGHTGDTATSKNEFTNARNAFDILTDAGVEYSISYGNHDFTPAGNDTSMYNKYFPSTLFQGFDSYGGSKDPNKSDNMYFTFKGGNTDYLIVALEYNPSNATISWADSVVAAHPNHKVIVTTHGYLQGDSAAKVEDENALAPAVGADRLWNNLLKKHENILMLICGHAWSQRYSGDLVMRQDKGTHGNTVYQIMANAQDIDGSRGGVGLLLMLRFSEDGNVIDFNWFSPVSGEAFRPNNQFKLALSNEVKLSGVEDGASYCGEASFTVDSKTTVTVKIGSEILQPVDGVYTVSGNNRTKTVTVLDPFGGIMTSCRIKVNQDHTGGAATCTAAAICEVCGESYGEPLSHSYGEDGICTACGEQKPGEDTPDKSDSTDDSDEDASFSPIFLLPIAAAVVIAIGAIFIALKKKKA